MSEFNWKREENFYLTSGERITFLQRDLADFNNTLNEELKPFFELPTLIQYSSSNLELIKGSIKNIIFGSEFIIFNINESVSNKDYCFHMPLNNEATLCCWRVDNVLDALQVKLDSISNKIYFQTGGEKLLSAIQKNNSQDLLILKIIDLFSESFRI